MYGEADGLDVIRNNLGSAGNVSLVVTDDEYEPWPVFQGPLSEILALLAEQRFFEFILVSENMNWCIFDTHHNSLVLAGEIAIQ